MSELIYKGDGSWLPGVPARNLSAAEVEQSGGVAFLLRSGLYALAKDWSARAPGPPYPPPAEPVNPVLLPVPEPSPVLDVPEVLAVPFAEEPEAPSEEERPRARARRHLRVSEAESPGAIEEV
jgi:hypothetical protein